LGNVGTVNRKIEAVTSHTIINNREPSNRYFLGTFSRVTKVVDSVGVPVTSSGVGGWQNGVIWTEPPINVILRPNCHVISVGKNTIEIVDWKTADLRQRFHVDSTGSLSFLNTSHGTTILSIVKKKNSCIYFMKESTTSPRLPGELLKVIKNNKNELCNDLENVAADKVRNDIEHLYLDTESSVENFMMNVDGSSSLQVLRPSVHIRGDSNVQQQPLIRDHQSSVRDQLQYRPEQHHQSSVRDQLQYRPEQHQSSVRDHRSEHNNSPIRDESQYRPEQHHSPIRDQSQYRSEQHQSQFRPEQHQSQFRPEQHQSQYRPEQLYAQHRPDQQQARPDQQFLRGRSGSSHDTFRHLPMEEGRRSSNDDHDTYRTNQTNDSRMQRPFVDPHLHGQNARFRPPFRPGFDVRYEGPRVNPMYRPRPGMNNNQHFRPPNDPRILVRGPPNLSSHHAAGVRPGDNRFTADTRFFSPRPPIRYDNDGRPYLPQGPRPGGPYYRDGRPEDQ
jgi:hypothetical protein